MTQVTNDRSDLGPEDAKIVATNLRVQYFAKPAEFCDCAMPILTRVGRPCFRPIPCFARRATARHRLKSAGHRHRLFMSPKTAAPNDGDGSLLQPDPPKGVAHDSRPHRCAPHALAHLTHARYAFNQLPPNRRSYKCLMNTPAAATHIVHCALGALADSTCGIACTPHHTPRPAHSRRLHRARCPDINARL